AGRGIPQRVPPGAGSDGAVRCQRIAWLVSVAGLAAGCGSAASRPSVAQTPARPATAHTATVKPHPPAHRQSGLPPANNGSLPQTDQRPSPRTPAFRAEMGALWTGVRTGSVHSALAAFFPQSAY